MPLHLAELKKIANQNEQIIVLLTKLTETQQPKKEVVLNKPVNRGNKNESGKQRPKVNGKPSQNSNK